MRVTLKPSGETRDIQGIRRVHVLLERLEILPGTVLVIRGDRLLTEDAEIFPDDEIELRAVVSGGL